LFSCEDFSQKSFASLINRARARRRARAREAIKPYIQSLDGGHNREKDCNSQHEETSGGRRLRRASQSSRSR